MENYNQNLAEAGPSIWKNRKNVKCSAVLGIFVQTPKMSTAQTEKNMREEDAIGKQV